MRDSPDGPAAERDDTDAASTCASDHGRGVGAVVGDGKDHDVRLNGIGGQPYSRVGPESRGDELRVCVILSEPVDMMLERVETGCAQNANLAHGTAEHPAMANAIAYHVPRTCQHRSRGSAQPLRERDGDDVEWRGQFLDGPAACGRCIP